MALEARRHITLTTTHPNTRNALYWLLIPLESYSGYKPIKKYDTLDHDNCIARGLHNGEFWSSGKRVLGGYRWGGVLCRIFPTKNIDKLLLDSMQTLWYTRASLYQYGLYMCCMPTPPPFSPPKKKLKKIKIPPCVSARLMVDYAALRPQKVQRSIIDNRTNRKQRQSARMI